MKYLNPGQLTAIRMRKNGSNFISIARYLGYSHTLIQRWFQAGHYVGHAYRALNASG